ncbi:tumor necrosis factor receptor superfamily member 10A-like [Otolemur garnettii]|uniref:tumor necrosis factor receptor superfamily member 10A-like n=1 Tax=Otolemur garnettii TaxID=30611 RepID=UPI000C7ED9F5|nr:tumor necrosis factor receptor superfamily member 10A-like [Otolemur garnettii]
MAGTAVPQGTCKEPWIWTPESSLCLSKVHGGGVPQGPGAEDNSLNQILNCRDCWHIRVPEQEQAELESVTVTFPGETECMLEQAEGEESQRTSLLPAANGSANPVDDTGAPLEMFTLQDSPQ